MNVETIIVSAIVAIVSGVITAYVTTRFRMKEEKAKWQREFAVKFGEANTVDKSGSRRIAEQFAIGFLIKDPKTKERERFFIPSGCRMIAGRAESNIIPVMEDAGVSKQHCAFTADDKDVFVEELGSPNGTFVNGELVEQRRKLESGDIITIGNHTEFYYSKLAA